ncbi:MAG: SocA family protein [Prevotellaceae bacterium]|jgi:uncharacterized phage-associated protein|nr:SocA family protein [Prevotellaceae bacterium]
MIIPIFNIEKSLNAVLYIAHKLIRKDFHKIFKILYFADRGHLVEYGRTITGDKYIAMNDGPVPSNIYDIFKSVRGDGFFKDDGKFSQYFSVVDWDLIIPKKQEDLGELSKTDLTHIDNSLRVYGDMSWDEVREKSHDYAWRNTTLNKEIEFENMIREVGGDDEFISFIKENYYTNNIIPDV